MNNRTRYSYSRLLCIPLFCMIATTYAEPPPEQDRQIDLATSPFCWTGNVSWSEEPLWPVTVSLRLKHNCDVITSMVVTSDAPFTICADLKPGEYQIYSELQDSSSPAVYWNAYGPAVLVPKQDGASIARPQDILHKKMMVPIYPMKEEIVSDRRPTLKWKPFPGAQFYRVQWFEKTAMEGRVIKTEQHIKTDQPEYTFEEDVVPNQTYEWCAEAYNGSEKQFYAYTPSCWFKTIAPSTDK